VNLKVPREFSLKLARHILALNEKGVKTNKADLILRLAELGFLEETKKDTKK
jgi:hypothetical protein